MAINDFITTMIKSFIYKPLIIMLKPSFKTVNKRSIEVIFIVLFEKSNHLLLKTLIML